MTTVDVREGDRLDDAALLKWLRRELPDMVPDDAQLSIRQFPSGFSNLTYSVAVHSAQRDQLMVLRRPPRGVKPGIAHDVRREYGILAALRPRQVPVPRPLAQCDDDSVIGSPFYVMEHVNGVILRGKLPASATGERDSTPEALSEKMSALSQTFVGTLATLHAVDIADEPLSSLGRPQGYVQRQVQGWTKRWIASRSSDVPEMEWTADWLDRSRPPERYTALLHNDFKLDNLVLSPDLGQVRAILDWEMATIGDPLLDLGTSLAYWVEANDAPVFRSLGLGMTAHAGCMTRAELVQAYGVATGRDVSDAPFYYVYGLFKVAVIAQQIYARHLQGLTSDPRFGGLGEVVQALARAARDAAARRTV